MSHDADTARFVKTCFTDLRALIARMPRHEQHALLMAMARALLEMAKERTLDDAVKSADETQADRVLRAITEDEDVTGPGYLAAEALSEILCGATGAEDAVDHLFELVREGQLLLDSALSSQARAAQALLARLVRDISEAVAAMDAELERRA